MITLHHCLDRGRVGGLMAGGGRVGALVRGWVHGWMNAEAEGRDCAVISSLAIQESRRTGEKGSHAHIEGGMTEEGGGVYAIS